MTKIEERVPNTIDPINPFRVIPQHLVVSLFKSSF